MGPKREPTPTNAKRRKTAWAWWYDERADDHFGARLKAARTLSRLSQERLAQQMGRLGFTNWHQTTVARTESGTRTVLLKEAVALSRILGGNLRLDWLQDDGSSAVEEWLVRAVEEERDKQDEIAKLKDALDALQQEVNELGTSISVGKAIISFGSTSNPRGYLRGSIYDAMRSPFFFDDPRNTELLEAVRVAQWEYSEALGKAMTEAWDQRLLLDLGFSSLDEIKDEEEKSRARKALSRRPTVEERKQVYDSDEFRKIASREITSLIMTASMKGPGRSVREWAEMMIAVPEELSGNAEQRVSDETG